ncbi:MAG: DsbE family thiol:disulfide interchange protein [Gammaproteobacteria bacterium]
MRLLRFLLPIALFAVVAAFLYKGLERDPRNLPSPLIGKAAPAFTLPVLGREGEQWSPEALRGKVWLLNVWGSWCAACRVEHPLLNDLARSGTVAIVGLAWKDKPEASTGWLQRLGDPYSVVVTDLDGRAGIDWGVYGAPETFLIDKTGTIRFKHVGAITPEVLQTRLMPMVRELQAAS